MTKIILHVGTMKTGTTSIQRMLSENVPRLSDLGFDVLLPPSRHSSIIAPALKKCIKAGRDLIISDEGLWHFMDTARSDTARLAALVKGCDVRVLVYFRRPDSFLQSWFLQGLKTGSGARSFQDFLNSSFVKQTSRPERPLARLEALFGSSSIQLRPYEKKSLFKGDAVSDFINTLGLPETGFARSPSANRTPGTERLLLRNMLLGPGKPSQSHREAVKRALDFLKLPSPTGNNLVLFTRSEIDELFAQWRPEFQRIQARYGGGCSPDFFEDWSLPDNAQEQPHPLRIANESFFLNLR